MIDAKLIICQIQVRIQLHGIFGGIHTQMIQKIPFQLPGQIFPCHHIYKGSVENYVLMGEIAIYIVDYEICENAYDKQQKLIIS